MICNGIWTSVRLELGPEPCWKKYCITWISNTFRCIACSVASSESITAYFRKNQKLFFWRLPAPAIHQGACSSPLQCLPALRPGLSPSASSAVDVWIKQEQGHFASSHPCQLSSTGANCTGQDALFMLLPQSTFSTSLHHYLGPIPS